MLPGTRFSRTSGVERCKAHTGAKRQNRYKIITEALAIRILALRLAKSDFLRVAQLDVVQIPVFREARKVHNR